LERERANDHQQMARRESQLEMELRRQFEEQEQRHREEKERLLQSLELERREREKVDELNRIGQLDMEVDPFGEPRGAAVESPQKRDTKLLAAKKKKKGKLKQVCSAQPSPPQLKPPPSGASITNPPPTTSMGSEPVEASFAGSMLNNAAAATSSAAASLFNIMRPEQISPESTTSSLHFAAVASGRLSPLRPITRSIQSEFDLPLEGLETWEVPLSRSRHAQAGSSCDASLSTFNLNEADDEVESNYGQDDAGALRQP
jgi:hypothetical protein